jgi:nucleotide-binding universal stress UspA family protein
MTLRVGGRRIAQSIAEEGERMFKVIVWVSDGSEHAERALHYARELAGTDSARLVAVHVREIMVGRAGGYPVSS